MRVKSKVFAKMCQYISRKREKSGIYLDISKHLLEHIQTGSLIDMGTGAGFLLYEINKQNSNIKLYGLDISEDVCKLARRNLKKFEVPAEIICNTLEDALFEENSFDIMTCTASFSYWRKPIESLIEIFRVLKPSGKAILFEPYKEVDMDKLVTSIKETLKDASRIRRFLAVHVNKFGIKHGHKFGIKLYTIKEFEELFQKTPFKDSYLVKETSVAGFHVFVKIILEKKV